MLGVPERNAEFPEYEGFQEAFSDCVSLIAAMHFPSVIDQVLDETRGNLYLSNRIARFSEFPANRQIRNANNTRTMDEFVDGYKNEHDLSEPLTGAIFDILADIFHESLVERGLISTEVEELAEMVEFGGAESAELQDAFDRAYADDSEGFAEALLDARDIDRHVSCRRRCGTSIPIFSTMATWRRQCLRSTGARPAGASPTSSTAISSGAASGFCTPGRASSRSGRPPASGRTVLPRDRLRLPKMSYRERYLLKSIG